MARHCSCATPKVEEWQSIDLADLRRWGMLDNRMLRETGRIPAITWRRPSGGSNTSDGLDQLGVITKRNEAVLFLKRDERGQLWKLLVTLIFTPTKFGGRRAWFKCPGCAQGCRVLYGLNSLRCRKCRGLKYQSQYELPAIRLLDRARKIRRKLGTPSTSGEPLPPNRYGGIRERHEPQDRSQKIKTRGTLHRVDWPKRIEPQEAGSRRHDDADEAYAAMRQCGEPEYEPYCWLLGRSRKAFLHKVRVSLACFNGNALCLLP
jgi:hypothetical protein